MTIGFVENDAPDSGNARSFWLAAKDMHAGFLLTMADHIVEPAIIRAVIDGAGERTRLAVDFAPYDDARAPGATLARVVAGRVVDLGKGIADWNGIDTGVFYCAPGIADAVTPAVRDGELAAIFAAIARKGGLDAIDVTGMRWIDVDTPDDLREAEAMMAAHGRID
jgi:choline kinase